jgi:hypothetical protein
MPFKRFVMLGINPHSYNASVWITSHFSGFLNIWWLNHKQHASILDTFDYVETKIRMTSMLPSTTMTRSTPCWDLRKAL